MTALEQWADQRGTRAQETTRGVEMRAQMNPGDMANVEATLARKVLRPQGLAFSQAPTLVKPQAGPAPWGPGHGAKEHRP